MSAPFFFYTLNLIFCPSFSYFFSLNLAWAFGCPLINHTRHMSKKIIVGINKETNAITPISKVNKVGLRCNCICYECKGNLEVSVPYSLGNHITGRILFGDHLQGLLHKQLKITTAGRITRTHPAVGYHLQFRYEGHQRMMRSTALQHVLPQIPGVIDK